MDVKQQKLGFLDTETTGLDPNKAEVIEVCVLVLYGGCEGCVPEVFHILIKPERLEDAHPKALEINGYAKHPERWRDAPTMTEVGDQIADVLRGCILVGHNVGFDERMLNANLKRSGIERSVPHHKIDTVTLAREHLTPLGLKRVSMDAIREFLGWSTEGAHTAKKDAEDVLRLYRLLYRMTWWKRLLLRFHLWRAR